MFFDTKIKSCVYKKNSFFFTDKPKSNCGWKLEDKREIIKFIKMAHLKIEAFLRKRYVVLNVLNCVRVFLTIRNDYFCCRLSRKKIQNTNIQYICTRFFKLKVISCKNFFKILWNSYKLKEITLRKYQNIKFMYKTTFIFTRITYFISS